MPAIKKNRSSSMGSEIVYHLESICPVSDGHGNGYSWSDPVKNIQRSTQSAIKAFPLKPTSYVWGIITENGSPKVDSSGKILRTLSSSAFPFLCL